MRRSGVGPLLLLLTAWAALAAGASPGARVAPLPDRPALEGAGWPRDRIFARLDSLVAVAQDPAQTDSLRARAHYRCAQLYLATDLIKHRRTALDHLERALALDPGLFGAGRLRAGTAHAMRYPGAARRWYRDLCRDFPEDARAWRLLGTFHLLEARRLLEEEQLKRAASAFARAVELDSTDVEARLGLGSALVALGWYDDAPEVLAPARADPTRGGAVRALHAAALSGRGDEEEAWEAFHRVLADEAPALRALFLDGRGFLDESRQLEEMAARLDPALLEAALARRDPEWRPRDGIDLKDALEDSTVLSLAVRDFWRNRNPRPSHLSNRNQLAYWQRLVEADLLFGLPAEGVRGWDRAPGAAWVRYGRPEVTLYLPQGAGRADALAPFALDPQLVFPDADAAVWVWGYRLGHRRFALLFEDRVLNGRWLAHESAALRLRYAQKQLPVLFDEGLDEEPTFVLELSTAAFHRPGGVASLETYLTVAPREGFGEGEAVLEEPAGEILVEWAVYDEDGGRLDYRRRWLGPGERQNALRDRVGLPAAPGEEDPWVCSLVADLRPGIYRVAVDVTEARGGFHRAREIALEIPSRAPLTLALSDLQLASTFEPLPADRDLPPGLVKHAFAILPRPGGVYPATAAELYVYFEVYNLATEDGMTRFDVSYEVYRRRDDGDGAPLWRRREREGLERIDPLSMTYVEESLGTSPQHHVVKGGVVDVGGLGAGRYLLVVGVTDRVTGETVERAAAFSKARPREAVGRGNGKREGRAQEPRR